MPGPVTARKVFTARPALVRSMREARRARQGSGIRLWGPQAALEGLGRLSPWDGGAEGCGGDCSRVPGSVAFEQVFTRQRGVNLHAKGLRIKKPPGSAGGMF